MVELAGAVALGVPALVGVGAGSLIYGWQRNRTRQARSRRLAKVVGLGQPSPGVANRARRAAWALVSVNWQRLSRTLIAHQVAATRSATVTILLGGVVGLLSGQVACYVPVVFAVAVLTWLRQQSAAHRRLEEQAPAALEMLSAGLRAGYSVPQAIARVGRESPQPTAGEFAAVGRELAVGSSLADSLMHLAQRTALADYTMVGTVIWIHGQVGGNLAVVLDSVVATLRDRFDLREQVRALTAQQRMASTTLSMLPLGVLMLLLLVDRPFVEPMFALPAGRVLLGIGAVLLAAGWGTMRALSRVEL
jgi:Flp pilus assembly protein TadB